MRAQAARRKRFTSRGETSPSYRARVCPLTGATGPSLLVRGSSRYSRRGQGEVAGSLVPLATTRLGPLRRRRRPCWHSHDAAMHHPYRRSAFRDRRSND